jgi:hypothetical protein
MAHSKVRIEEGQLGERRTWLTARAGLKKDN